MKCGSPYEPPVPGVDSPGSGRVPPSEPPPPPPPPAGAAGRLLTGVTCGLAQLGRRAGLAGVADPVAVRVGLVGVGGRFAVVQLERRVPPRLLVRDTVLVD